MTAQLTAEFWMQAYFRRLGAANLHFYVIKKGDPTAGAVIVKVNRLDGSALMYQREYADQGTRRWVKTDEGPEADIDKSITNQSGFDPDLWVIEVESPTGNALLDEDGLSG